MPYQRDGDVEDDDGGPVVPDGQLELLSLGKGLSGRG